LNVLELRHTTVDDVIGAMEVLGRATGTQKRAAELNAATRADLDAIRRKSAALPKRRLMFIVGRTPNAIEGLMAVGKASYLNELIAIAGGVNVFADSVSPYPKVSLEEVLARDPEVIVDMGEMAETVGVTDEQKRRVERLWQRYSSIAAVKRNGVHAVASDNYVVPGPRMVDAAREFARMLHPEAGL
jgi:iron complex transport system substrate-binding protein